MPSKLLHSTASVKTALDIGNSKFWALVKEGRFDARKMGGAVFITDESLRAFIDNLPKAATAPEGTPAKVV